MHNAAMQQHCGSIGRQRAFLDVNSVSAQRKYAFCELCSNDNMYGKYDLAC
jgi:hypothetical protein